MKSLHYYISSTMLEQAEITQDTSGGKERITVNLPTVNFMNLTICLSFKQ